MLGGGLAGIDGHASEVDLGGRNRIDGHCRLLHTASWAWVLIGTIAK
jgi:hypothetical protein